MATPSLSPAVRAVLLLVGVLFLTGALATNFNVVDTTIDQIQRSLAAGNVTCQQIIQLHLDRINAYDKVCLQTRASTCTNAAIPTRPPTHTRVRGLYLQQRCHNHHRVPERTATQQCGVAG
jgi:hypothetical protein